MLQSGEVTPDGVDAGEALGDQGVERPNRRPQPDRNDPVDLPLEPLESGVEAVELRAHHADLGFAALQPLGDRRRDELPRHVAQHRVDVFPQVAHHLVDDPQRVRGVLLARRHARPGQDVPDRSAPTVVGRHDVLGRAGGRTTLHAPVGLEPLRHLLHFDADVVGGDLGSGEVELQRSSGHVVLEARFEILHGGFDRRLRRNRGHGGYPWAFSGRAPGVVGTRIWFEQRARGVAAPLAPRHLERIGYVIGHLAHVGERLDGIGDRPHVRDVLGNGGLLVVLDAVTLEHPLGVAHL